MIRTLKSVDCEIEILQNKIKKIEQIKTNFEKLSKIYPDIKLDNRVFCSETINKDYEKVAIKTWSTSVEVSPYCVVDGIKVFSYPKSFQLITKKYNYNYGPTKTTSKLELKVFDLEELKKRYNLNEDIFSHKKVKMALISFIKKNEGVKIVNLKDNKLLTFLAPFL